MKPENIFIGPLLRYCDPFLVTICLATLHPMKLRFSVGQSSKEEWLAHDERPLHIAVSKNLHFYFARIHSPKQAFPQETLLVYSIAVLKEEMLSSPSDNDPPDPPDPAGAVPNQTESDSSPVISGDAPPTEDDNEKPPLYPDHFWDYKPFENVVNEDGLAYEGVTLPTFFLQKPGQKLNLIYGSCRKFHDVDPKTGGAYDALALGDDLVAKHLNDLSHRPAIACLGGDQIYADDVHPDTIKQVLDWANFFEEDKRESLPNSLSVPDAGERTQFVEDQAGFTANITKELRDVAKNHLITLAEYLAMYGLAWNPRNWTNPPKDLAPYLRDLPAVRRLLANIPTYMIFDDHEVTDDWNISIEWKNKVEKSAVGNRIIGNALMAYWLCQGYGNAPKKWVTVRSSNRTLDFHLDWDHAREYGALIQERHRDRASYDFAVTSFLGLGKNNKWEFATPTDPFVYFLDLRTQRAHKDDHKKNPKAEGTPAFLKSVAGWSMTISSIERQLKIKKPKVLILVAAIPVIGYSAIEMGQGIVGGFNSYILDDENWGNSHHLLMFLESLLDNNVVVLSGDVHYSFSSTARFVKFDDAALRIAIEQGRLEKRPPNTSTPLPSYRVALQSQILQLTSSGLMNFASKALDAASRLDFLNLAELNDVTLNNDVFLQDGTMHKGNVVNGTVILTDNSIDAILARGLPVVGPLKTIFSTMHKPRGMLTRETSRFTCSPYLASHNLGVASFEEKTVTNYFLTYSGKKHEMRWNFDDLRRR